MKKLILINIFVGLLASLLIVGTVTAATVLFPSGGGTGTVTKPSKGSLLVGASSTAYCVVGIGSNGKVLTASSSATCGASWETAAAGGITSFNGSTSSTQTISTGTGISWTTANGVHTVTNTGITTTTGNWLGTWQSNNPSAFVPYTGATVDVDLGAFSYQASGGGNLSLNGEDGGSLYFTNAAGDVNWITITSEIIDSFKITNSINASALLDFSLLSAGDKTFTFPDQSGIFLVAATSTDPDGYCFIASSTSPTGYDLAVCGGGGGDMYKADNLSGLADLPTARDNLGLGSIATFLSTDYLPSSTAYVATTTGNWIGTFQLKNATDFLSSSTAYVATTTGSWLGTWQGLATSTFLKTALNLSDSNTSTVRTNLGLTDTAVIASSTWLKVALNLSDGNTSTMRTNLGLGTLATANSVAYASTTGVMPQWTTAFAYASTTHITATTPLSITSGVLSMPTSTATQNGFLTSANWVTFNAKITTSSITETITGIDYSSSTTGVFSLTSGYEIPTTASTSAWNAGGAVPGSNTQIIFNNGGAFGAVSGFTYASGTKRLNVNAATTSSVVIGSTFYEAASSVSLAYSGATSTWTVPTGVTSITITVIGGSGNKDGNNTNFGAQGGTATGTMAVSAGQVFYYSIGNGGGTGKTANFGGGGAGGAGYSSTYEGGAGGGMTWVSTSGAFGTSTVLIVGAGGGGTPRPSARGGYGGGLTGGNASGTSPGLGGTQTAGGAGGGGLSAGTAGSAGQGGTGGALGYGGAGGGGGYYGGGGGSGSEDTAVTGGGGGGSSYLGSSLTTTSTSNGAATGTTAGSIVFSYNRASNNAATDYNLAVGGHILVGGSNPTISCGTSASATGTDVVGVITTGSNQTATTSCALTFANQFYNAPVCVANTNSTSTYVGVTAVTTSTVIFGTSATYATKPIYYHCLSY